MNDDTMGTLNAPDGGLDSTVPPSPSGAGHAPRPAAERHARQMEVEGLLGAFVPTRRIALSVSAKYHVSTRIVWRDIAGVRRRWTAEARKRGDSLREAMLRATQDLLLRDRQAGDREGERLTLTLLAKVIGVGQSPTINLAAGTAIVNAGTADLLGGYSTWSERIAAEAAAPARPALPAANAAESAPAPEPARAAHPIKAPGV